MKNLKRLLVFALLLGVTGCARTCESLDRKWQITPKQCVVEEWSGGVLVNKWEFKGMVNNSTNSDGYYFSIGDTIHEVSGDVHFYYIDD